MYLINNLQSSILLSLASSALANSSNRICKAAPGSPSWPSDSTWAALNKTVGGVLIKAVPPGGVCHPGQPNYNNNASCQAVSQAWTTSWTFHGDDPVSNAYNNWNNDTCLP